MEMNMKDTEKWLKKAIERHERHMMGEEPTTGKDGEISQKLMMEEMKMAYKALFSDDVNETAWYKANVGKFSGSMKM
jgi:hypothetical protein